MIPFVRILNYGNTVRPIELGAVSAYNGHTHIVLLDTRGDLWGTGRNQLGQLGFSDISAEYLNKWVKIKSSVRIAYANTSYTVVITTTNSVLYCGSGLVNNTVNASWVDITSSMGTMNIASITKIYGANGMLHFKDTNGNIYAFGLNNNQNSGLNIGANPVTTATQVPIVSGVKDIKYTAAAGSVLCINGNDQVYCWGRNANGELGQGNTNVVGGPTLISASLGYAVGGGYSACVRVLQGGQVQTAGNQYAGQIGNGQTAENHVAVTSFANRSFSGVVNSSIRTPSISGGTFTLALMCTDGIYYTGKDGRIYGAASNTTVGTFTKTQTLPVPINLVLSWGANASNGFILTQDAIYQCGDRTYIIGGGSSDIVGYTKTLLPWENGGSI